MRLVTLQDKIVQTDHHTLLIMRGGKTCQAVCVVDDGEKGDIRSKLSLIEMIASKKLDRGDLAFDGRIWIMPADLSRRH